MSEKQRSHQAHTYSSVELPLEWTSPCVSDPQEGFLGDGKKTAQRHNRSSRRGLRDRGDSVDFSGISSKLLADLQDEVGELERDRGTSSESVVQKGLILSEEAFEVLKILRPRAGIATAKTVTRLLADELADILFVVAAIANRVDTRLDHLWDTAEPDWAAMTKRAGPPSEEKVLEATIDLAHQILVVIVDCREVQNGRERPKKQDDLTEDIRTLVVLVQAVAETCDVDLRRAINGKLNKDQLRLWSV
ncbi:hypothetical protein Q3V37_25745 [Micromonospora profundi]|uniref:NTP pyrophosphohydrolase MazG putative catalytic core domain-containing protein n=1 Tax=Micromonospora profundi TaxID=1420889 RepID=A0AAJ6HRB1_9ACTN|nr:hypothetical protein [Micromonospora profundi]WLS44757.1 hypothetical protein Q3V37_25745 [Micromonospora profundi]